MQFSTYFSNCPVCGSNHFIVNSVKSKRCESCGFVYYMNPSAAVAAFIQNENGDLLVCKRAKDPEKGTLDLPGGFVDADETAEEAICREIKEELNAEVVATEYQFTIPNQYEYSGLTIPTLDIFFKCKLRSNNNFQPADDVEDCFFVPKSTLNPALFGLKSIKKAVEIYLTKCEN